MSASSSAGEPSPEAAAGGTLAYYKRDFWSQENLKYSRPHYRLEKMSRIVNRVAGHRDCTLLDVGCGPATLRDLLVPNVSYFGADIAIREPAPYLLEADFTEQPISFGGRRFDIVVAQGFFEYIGAHQARKLAEIAKIIRHGGLFIATYVNFGHREPEIYWPYSNVQPLAHFRRGLAARFEVRRFFPTSHNWHHSEPRRPLVRAINMRLDVNVPLISPLLAVEYFFICRPRGELAGGPRPAGRVTPGSR